MANSIGFAKNYTGIMDDMATVAAFSDEKFDALMAVNVYGPFAATRKAVQVFLEQGDGAISSR